MSRTAGPASRRTRLERVWAVLHYRAGRRRHRRWPGHRAVRSWHRCTINGAREVEDAQAPGERIGEPRNREHVGSAGEEQASGRPIRVDGGRERGEELQQALELVEGHALREVTRETVGIGAGGLTLASPHRRDSGAVNGTRAVRRAAARPPSDRDRARPRPGGRRPSQAPPPSLRPVSGRPGPPPRGADRLGRASDARV
jgi:hypothetical protein